MPATAAQLKSNIWKLYVMQGIRGFMVMMPTIVLFFQENGLSMVEIFLLQTLFSVAIVVVEIPSGYFADRFGRRRSIILGSVLAFLSLVIYSFATDFWGFLAAETLLGIGFAFTSGADSALLYDSLVETGGRDTYKRREGWSLSISNFSETIASVLGGYLALITLRTPVIVEAFALFFLIPVAYSLYEARKHIPAAESVAWTMRKTIIHTLHTNAALRWIIVLYALIFSSGLVMVWFRQPYLQEANVPLVYFGYIWAALMLSVALSSLLSEYVEKTLGRRRTMLVVLGFMTAGYFILGIDTVWWFVPAMLLFCIGRGLWEPVIKDYVQVHAPSEVRATVLSIKSFAARSLFAILGPFAGWLADIYTLQFALIASGIFFLVFGVIATVLLISAETRDSQAVATSA